MLPTAFWTTPSVPHFGHLFVGWVGAGMWTGMTFTLPRSGVRRRSPAPRGHPYRRRRAALRDPRLLLRRAGASREEPVREPVRPERDLLRRALVLEAAGVRSRFESGVPGEHALHEHGRKLVPLGPRRCDPLLLVRHLSCLLEIVGVARSLRDAVVAGRQRPLQRQAARLDLRRGSLSCR